MLPGLMELGTKPRLGEGLNGAWLLIVVGTQAVSVLACLLVPTLAADAPTVPLFIALMFWLVGSMLYIWLIALIFHRILFLPLAPDELTPPYWIDMGAMAISTLAGTCLIREAGRMPLLGELLPFLNGMTLLFWATGTWWIPILLVLGLWRHLYKHVSLTYDHGFWAAVFPLGMYAACTQDLARVLRLTFLEPVAAVFVWIALGAWLLTLADLIGYLVWRIAGRAPHTEPASVNQPHGQKSSET
jgi:tellurite resistance protein TehA-like permease